MASGKILDYRRIVSIWPVKSAQYLSLVLTLQASVPQAPLKIQSYVLRFARPHSGLVFVAPSELVVQSLSLWMLPPML